MSTTHATRSLYRSLARPLVLACLAVLLTATGAAAQITLVHTPLREFHSDHTNGYIVKAKITSTAGSINVRRVYYAVDGTNFTGLLFMQPTGTPDEWQATIPAQPRGTIVRYYVHAADTSGNLMQSPMGAPGQGETCHVFRIGHYRIVFADDFESGNMGWTTGGGTDDWQRADPNQGGQAPNDPTTAWSGTTVYGNNLDGTTPQSGFYLANNQNYLDSPAINCSGTNDLHLNFRRWLTVEEGIYDKAIIQVLGNTVYINPSRGHVLDAEWKYVNIDISEIAAGHPAVVVHFELQTDAGLEFGGWNIDDFRIIEEIKDWVTYSVSNNNPSIGEWLDMTVTANPNTNWYLLDAKGPGNGSFDVPSGPSVASGLEENEKNRFSGMTDGTGTSTLRARVPNRNNLIGIERWTSVVGFASGWVDSNLIKYTVMP